MKQVSSYETHSPLDLSNVDDVHDVDISQERAVEVATRSHSSASCTTAHTSVAEAYKDEQYCMAHLTRIPQPNTGETMCVGHYTASFPYTSTIMQNRMFISPFSSHPSFLCSSRITTDHWEDPEGVSHAEGTEGVW